MVVPIIGSLAVRGVFAAGGLLSGLGKTAGKLKETQAVSKSTTTEMKRMTGQSHLLAKALSLIGVGGFTALLMQTPQLSGALAKIKNEMMLIAWAIGKHLKPVLDSVATILHAIRTGNWDEFKSGISDLGSSIMTILGDAWDFIATKTHDALMSNKYTADFITWIEDLKTAWDDGDLLGVIKSTFYSPIKWMIDNASTIVTDIKNALVSAFSNIDVWEGFKTTMPAPLKVATGIGEFGIRMAERYLRGEQIGGVIPSTGAYYMHAGETVIPAGASPMTGGGGATNITVDFSGANINLANGVELNEFADAISLKIAERQGSLIY